ncbi:MAG: class I SAM-dependent DNA methyltransferase [Flavobacteriales bacterium]|nr:class I SAM-dependent DNA methyltransferase [Flavobacteriales bacterium]
MRHQTIGPRKALNKAFLKQKPERKNIEGFKAALIGMLDHAKPGESEEYHKNLVSQFLKESGFAPAHYINTKGRNDLVIHTGKDAESPVGVIIEAKRPGNGAEMPKADDLRCKALNELLLYYLRERIGSQNIALKHLVITDLHQWYLFDAATWEKPVAQDKALVKRFQDFEAGRLAGRQTDFFYKEVAAPFFDSLDVELPVVYFTMDSYSKILRNADRKDDAPLIALHKLLSPQHLLKLPFANDSNSLDREFYAELLHLIGLEEVKEKGKWLIGRKPPERRDRASLLEAAIIQLDSLDKLERVERLHSYGDTRDEQLFHVALELCITWVNRVLFLKLLEAQVVTYHGGSKAHTFLHSGRVRNYDDLNSLFFQVLARKPQERSTGMAERFGKVPYLNSSLFEPTELEHRTLFISNLEDERPLPLHKATVLKNDQLKRLSGTLPALDYLFRFLDAYDFTSEGGEEVQEENKRLINASVLGLIFEKINGYKDGSFFTPGFITMYMCREALRPAVLRRFNTAFEAEGAKACADFDELRDRIESGREARAAANALINGLRICDPAVGSGHFLVSALNELIAIKSELGILSHRNGDRVRHQRIAVENDELVVYDEEEGSLFEYRVGPDGRASAERQQLQETLFHEKQTLIEQCLFGVDINPNSVKICRLRLWIELLKHTYYLPGTQELETLPNIDINIKCGNSLIHRFALDADLAPALRKSKWNMDSYRLAVQTYRHAEDKAQKREMERLIDTIKGDFQVGISQDSKAVRDLNKAKNEYYLAYEKEQLFDAEGKPRLTRKQLEHRRKLEAKINSLTQVVEDLKNNVLFTNAFEWRFEFPEVLDDEGRFTGFDVVIGNPPYIRQEAFKAIKPYLKDHYRTFAGTADLFTYFIEFGLALLSPHGQFAFIVPNKWMRAGYGKALRVHLGEMAVQRITDFGDLPVFEEATTYPCVLHVTKAAGGHGFPAATLNKLPGERSLDDLIAEAEVQVQPASLNAEGWALVDARKQALLDKLRAAGKPLGEYVGGKIFYGIKTGLNEAFVIDAATRERLIAEDARSAKVIKPFLAGKDIKRYERPVSNKYLIFTRRGIDIDQYPAIKKHLEQFREQLEPRPLGNVDKSWPGRKAGNYQWYEIQDTIDYWQSLERPKILYQEIAMSHAFAYDEAGLYVNNKLFMLVDVPMELLAYLNSSVVWFLLWQTTTRLRGDALAMQTPYILNLPVHSGVMENEALCKKASEVLDARSSDPASDASPLEREIDALVYGLYDLTAEEIALVEAAVGRG